MAMLDEQLVEEWLNSKGFFTMRGIKHGVDEIDLLAIRPQKTAIECWHVEVQISFRPIGYYGGSSSAKKRSELEIQAGVKDWVKKKFTQDRKVTQRESILASKNWKYVLIHGNFKAPSTLHYLKNEGVQTVSYRKILQELSSSTRFKTNALGSHFTELIEFMKSPAQS